MSLSLLMDEHVKSAVTDGLRRRGCDVLTAQEDESDGLPDPRLLDRATILGRVLVTNDDDFLVEAAKRQAAGASFSGVVFGRQNDLTVGKMIDDLELIAWCYESQEVANQVLFIPLK
jgi:predicted nuclease of predicted toxin-antitoxin system